MLKNVRTPRLILLLPIHIDFFILIWKWIYLGFFFQSYFRMNYGKFKSAKASASDGSNWPWTQFNLCHGQQGGIPQANQNWVKKFCMAGK